MFFIGKWVNVNWKLLFVIIVNCIILDVSLGLLLFVKYNFKGLEVVSFVFLW